MNGLDVGVTRAAFRACALDVASPQVLLLEEVGGALDQITCILYGDK